jgi:Rap1a immunity proteins
MAVGFDRRVGYALPTSYVRYIRAELLNRGVMSSKWVLSAGILLALAIPTKPQESVQQTNGNSLLDKCVWAVRASTDDIPEKHQLAAVECSSYLGGYADGLMVGTTLVKEYSHDPSLRARFCLDMPESWSQEQLVRVVTKWLQDHPEELHEDQHLLVGLALRDAFPCK